MEENLAKPHSAIMDAQTQGDRAVTAMLSDIRCTELDPYDLRGPDHSHISGGMLSFDELGRGSYAVVLLGRLEGHPSQIAIKRPFLPEGCPKDREDAERKSNYARSRKESMVHQLLSGSPFFPALLGTVTLEGDLCVVTEFVGDKTTGRAYPLYYALCPINPEPILTRWNMAAVAEDIVRGVMVLHGHGLLHNDLKDDNVLLEHRGQRWHAVIIDLGLVSTMARSITLTATPSDQEARRQKRDNFTHIASEVVLEGACTNESTDIYSVGMLLGIIGRFIQEADLVTVAESCTQDWFPLRPRSLAAVLPDVVAVKDGLQSRNSVQPKRCDTVVLYSHSPEDSKDGVG
ncbi:protein kinase C delta type-like [Diadema setosum]|uniref:protein kinase C delta type-like n=1 Tax=Diadema setosum TaxID=31175 RepID=UPI003B3B88B5